MKRYATCHQSCATVLRFVLGDQSHLRTYLRKDGRVVFEFADPDGKGSEVAQMFFSPEGAAVSNARELLACDREVRRTVGECINSTNKESRNEG